MAFGYGKFGEEKGRRKKRRREKKEEEKFKKSQGMKFLFGSLEVQKLLGIHVWNTIMEILSKHLHCDVWNLYVRKYLSKLG